MPAAVCWWAWEPEWAAAAPADMASVVWAGSHLDPCLPPVLVSHSISVNVEFDKKCNLDEIRNVLSTSPGCKVIDEHKDGGYITPVEAEDKFETFISRIRLDESQKNTINMWIVSDNLLKGAALNAIQIAEALIKNDFYGQ